MLNFFSSNKINRFCTSFLLVAAVAFISGCGGGGGSGVTSTPSTTGTTTGTATTTVIAPTLSISIADPVTGASKTSISAGNGAMVSATIKDAKGVPVSSALVSFVVATPDLAVVTPSAATALTDSTGVAKIRLDAATFSAAGATTITATSTLDAPTITTNTSASGVITTSSTTTSNVTGRVNFTVGAVAVTLSGLKANLPSGATTLSPYATTTISVTVGGVPSSTQVAVSFTSTCASAGKAALDATVTSANGIATATYADKGCAGTDKITATAAGFTTVPIDLVVASPTVAAIQFVSATPSTIVLKGTGGSGLVESSIVKYKLVDNNGQPIASKSLVLSLSTSTGGILLDGGSVSVTKQTNSVGEVTASVSAGTVPTPVWVNATYTDGAISFTTQSVKIQISTGRPVQDRFSLSIETLNIEGMNHDFVSTKVNVIASDRVGNPVPDGTAINFISNGGQIGTDSLGVCTTVNGTCSVKFISANPRPPSGRVAVVAYAVGEESFRDDNGNNYHEANEPYEDLGDLFVDGFPFNTTKDVGEQQINFGIGGKVCGGVDANGAQTNWHPSGAISTNMASNTCDQVWGSAHVRQQGIIVFSSSTPNLLTSTTLSMAGKCSASFSVTLDDGNNNILPAGTVLSISDLSFGVGSTTTATVSPGVVGNSTAVSSEHTITVTAPSGCAPVLGSFNLTVKTPLGAARPFLYTVQ